MSLEVLTALVFLVVTGGVLGVFVLVGGRSQAALRRTIDYRVREISHRGELPDSLIRTHTTGPLPGVDRVARRAMGGLSLERWIEQSGLRLSLSALFLIAIVAGGALGFAAAALSHRLWIGAIAFVAGASLPFVLVWRRRAIRLNRLEEQFPEALDLLSRAVRAGHAFSAGMKMVADEVADPVGPEFRKTFEEQNYGLPLKESLDNLAARVPVLDVRFFATAVLIQRETGGNLAEILDNLASVVRERFKIQRQVRVHTAHGRFTGYVLLALPAFLAIALSFINPEHMEMLFDDQIGHMLIIMAIVMQAVGWVWIKRVVKIEV